MLRDFFFFLNVYFINFVGGKIGDVHGGILLPPVLCLVFGLMFSS